MGEYPLFVLVVNTPFSSFLLLILSGDSYTATGFSVHSRPPDDEEPFGNPPYPGITHHEGPTWVLALMI